MTTLAEAATAGNQLATLRELRDVLARAIVATSSGRDMAALTARFESVLDKIAALEAGAPDANKGTALDEFSKRRAAKQTTSSAGPAKRKQRR